MLLKSIQNPHEKPSFGIACYKNHESAENMRQLNASTLTHSISVIDSGGSVRKQIYML